MSRGHGDGDRVGNAMPFADGVNLAHVQVIEVVEKNLLLFGCEIRDQKGHRFRLETGRITRQVELQIRVGFVGRISRRSQGLTGTDTLRDVRRRTLPA